MSSKKRGQRKTQELIQKNRLDYYSGLKKTKSECDEVVSNIIDELIISSVTTSGDICATILVEVLSRIITFDSFFKQFSYKYLKAVETKILYKGNPSRARKPKHIKKIAGSV